eukprot:TRINITY_DN26867_c0_g1_i1.p1 TRINITY_DN26867_c0_g1~~TRINITY_DN26867_c0_g1_i1.p1  ORF type:complete len:1112 (+),score=322.75 TRINITY_DN26867_c0_g1_i1:42-3377(+)
MHEEDTPTLGQSHGRDPHRKTRPKAGRSPQAPPSLSHTGGRRRSSGSAERETSLDGSHKFAPGHDEPDSPDIAHALGRRASLYTRSVSPNPSPRQGGSRRVSGIGSGTVGLPPPNMANTEAANVRVMVRVRPFGNNEIEEVKKAGGYIQSVIGMPRKDQVLLLDKEDYEVYKGFNFDEVFWSCTQQKANVEFSDQKKVYEQTGKPALQAAWEGINSCIFAYGQTGSGKTHTMMGDPEQIAQTQGCEEDELGVIPRLCRDLFNQLQEKGETASKHGLRRKSDVRVRFYEIYNEKVKDLLGNYCEGGDTERFKYAGAGSARKLDPEDLKIREHPTEGPYVEGISIHNPRNYDDIIALINAGNQERSVGSTNLNDRSSRSHAIFRITVTQTTFYDQQRVGIGGPKTTTHQRRANVNLVDLAGSENVKRSGASGSVLLEAQKINLSLTTLRRVIDALIEKKSKVNVPYRDSTLTWLLREDLGGNAKTYMLATVSPHLSNFNESLRTLEYAMRARSIVNQVRVNEDETAKMLADLEKKMFETAQEMTKVESEADRVQLEQQMAEAESAKHEIQERLEEAAAEALQYKAKLEAEKEKNMAFAFRHAVMMRAAKQRLFKAETKYEGQTEELESIKKKMMAIGHDNMDDLAVSLSRERGKVHDLLSEKNEIQNEKDRLLKEHQELLQRYEREEVTAKQEKQAADEVTRDLARKDVQYKTQLNVMKQQLHEEYDALVEHHKQQTARMEESHDKELRAILDENQAMAEEFQAQIEGLKRENEVIVDGHGKQVRVLEQDQQQQQRYLHADIQRREEMIDKLESELNVATKQRNDFSEQIARFSETAAKDKAEAVVDQERSFQDMIKHLKQEHAVTCAHLRDLAVKADEEAAEKHREKIELQRFFADVGKREEKYSKTFDLVCHFLDQLPDGELPPGWTLEDIKKMIKAFQAFKREYASYRPNKEKLKAMLRVNPTRRGADRIRELLENPDVKDDDDQEQIHVLMGGMKCPELGGTIGRLESNQEGNNGNEASAAANVPYTTDSTGAGVTGNSSTFAPAKPSKTTRRSRSSPRNDVPTEAPAPAVLKKKTPRTAKVIKPLASDASKTPSKRPSTTRTLSSPAS